MNEKIAAVTSAGRLSGSSVPIISANHRRLPGKRSRAKA